MLLCDMSALNANVFFELGMRTAANKPVALIKDDATPNTPFDLNIINHHTYSHELQVWKIKEQINLLRLHLESCMENSDSGNALWNYFSVSSKAVPIASELEGLPLLPWREGAEIVYLHHECQGVRVKALAEPEARIRLEGSSDKQLIVDVPKGRQVCEAGFIVENVLIGLK